MTYCGLAARSARYRQGATPTARWRPPPEPTASLFLEQKTAHFEFNCLSSYSYFSCNFFSHFNTKQLVCNVGLRRFCRYSELYNLHDSAVFFLSVFCNDTLRPFCGHLQAAYIKSQKEFTRIQATYFKQNTMWNTRAFTLSII